MAALPSRQRMQWEEICDDFAKVAAIEFSRKCYQFVADHIVDDAPTFFAKTSKRFVDRFRQDYETELQRIMNSERPVSRQTEQDVPYRDKSQTDTGEGKSPKQSRVSRKFSMRLRNIFKKQENKENIEPSAQSNGDHDVGVLVDISPEKETMSSTGNDKTGSGHDIIKEGFLHELINIERNGDVELTWQKCRLVLARAPGGYMLEFYIPPKASKPRTGVFCFLLHEARQATELEMPDADNVFMVKAINNKEYMIAAEDKEDMNQWLDIIHRCMEEDTSAPSTPNPMNTATNFIFDSQGQHVLLQFEDDEKSGPGGNRSKVNQIRLSRRKVSEPAMSPSREDQDAFMVVAPPPEVPPRPEQMPTTYSGDKSKLEDGSRKRETTGSEWCSLAGANHPLASYPWFHGTLSRVMASILVLHGGQQWHGVFLVRQSETKQGEYVLTFNLQGRSKHLRLGLNSDGQCRVQHLWFTSIFDMLENFRSNPIPLENGGPSDVTLTNFVIAEEPPQGRSESSSNNASVFRRSQSYTPGAMNRVAAQTRIHNGSVRLTRQNLDAALPSRAVDNAYSVV
ncbi:SH2B adapter protein 2-like [Rhopilema esculentum]|uniref:SH2B adapter protein 2-like n=1 Tax=Rhopilema esculentum TaxID=499914 RepID=UPI0031CF0E21